MFFKCLIWLKTTFLKCIWSLTPFFSPNTYSPPERNACWRCWTRQLPAHLSATAFIALRIGDKSLSWSQSNHVTGFHVYYHLFSEDNETGSGMRLYERLWWQGWTMRGQAGGPRATSEKRNNTEGGEKKKSGAGEMGLKDIARKTSIRRKYIWKFQRNPLGTKKGRARDQEAMDYPLPQSERKLCPQGPQTGRSLDKVQVRRI